MTEMEFIALEQALFFEWLNMREESRLAVLYRDIMNVGRPPWN